MAAQAEELCIPAELKSLAEVAEFVADCCQRWGVYDDLSHRIQLAVDEAATNVIEHAYERRRRRPVGAVLAPGPQLRGGAT